MNLLSNLPEIVRELILKYDLYLVGGSVRDILSGKKPGDFDLSARDVKTILNDIGRSGKIVTLDEKEGEYRVVFKGFWVDISKMKGEGIEDDLRKRDFTINSIAVDKNGQIIDPTLGQKDIEKGIIRTISIEHLKSDPLRVLRAFRFYATLGFEIESKTLKWLMEVKGLLNGVSGERIRQEMFLILSSKRVFETFKFMCNTEVMDVIFPCVQDIRKTAQRYYNEQNLLYHSLTVLKYLEESTNGKNITIRPAFFLGAFLHDAGKPLTLSYDEEGNTHFHGHDKEGAKLVEQRLKELKFSSKEIEDVKKIVEFHMYPHHLAGVPELTKKAVARFLRRTGEYADFLLYFAEADAKASPPREGGMSGYEKLKNLVNEIRMENKDKPERIINGYDLINLGFKPSPMFKTILEDVEDEFKAGNLKNKKDALKYVKEKYKQGGTHGKSCDGNAPGDCSSDT